MKKKHVYKVQHQLEIKAKILCKTKDAFENVEDKILRKNKPFLRNKMIVPIYYTTNTPDFKPFTKENPTKVIGELLYSFYRKLTSEETRKSISLDNKNYHSFLKSNIELADENAGILQQLKDTKWLGDEETLLLRNLEETFVEPVPEKLSLAPIDKNDEGERCFAYNYTNVFNKVLSKHNKYCSFSFKYNHIHKENSRKR